MYNPKLHFYFTGIGGAGMSAIARILLDTGFQVSGSDLHLNESCEELQALGARIVCGHAAENLSEDISLLVYSSAVGFDNVEFQEALRRGIPVVRRAEVLAELMRLKFGVAVAGSHGKTTTTNMIGHVLVQAGLDPTILIGGQLSKHGTGARFGRSEYLVAETDESDRSFLLLKPSIAVVTNIDEEHMQAYASLDDLRQSFHEFVMSVPFYGLAVFCADHPETRALAREYTRRKILYGFSEDADIQARCVHIEEGRSSFEVWMEEEKVAEVNLPLPGRHLVQNALASFAVGMEFGIALQDIAQALGSLVGVKRRSELLYRDSETVLISDYGHHPTEILATLAALKESWCRKGETLQVIFQPHRYSRTRDCFAEFCTSFCDADELFMTDIYAASEIPIPGISGQVLCEALSHTEKYYCPSLDDALCCAVQQQTGQQQTGQQQTAQQQSKQKSRGRVLVFLGAGNIGSFAEEYARKLRAQNGKAIFGEPQTHVQGYA